MPALREQLHVVLHQIRSPANLGAVARLMANFGYSRLTLSDPLTWAIRDAERVAVRGQGVLERMRLCQTLDEALAESSFVVGTTGRAVLYKRAPISPEEAVAKLAERAQGGPVALLLGGEQRGLSDAELERCHEILVIPTEAAQPSMNLANAAAVLLYLCSRQERPEPEGPAELPEHAKLRTLYALEERMKEVLLRAEFLNPEAPEHVLRELGRTLVRGNLTQREAEVWLSAFAHLKRRVK